MSDAARYFTEICSGKSYSAIEGAFTRQSKNGTDPTKTGTVAIVFAKKQGSFIRSVSGP